MDKYHWLDQSSKSLFENIQRDLGINNFDDVSVDRSIDFALKISNQLTERQPLLGTIRPHHIRDIRFDVKIAQEIAKCLGLNHKHLFDISMQEHLPLISALTACFKRLLYSDASQNFKKDYFSELIGPEGQLADTYQQLNTQRIYNWFTADPNELIYLSPYPDEICNSCANKVKGKPYALHCDISQLKSSIETHEDSAVIFQAFQYYMADSFILLIQDNIDSYFTNTLRPHRFDSQFSEILVNLALWGQITFSSQSFWVIQDQFRYGNAYIPYLHLLQKFHEHYPENILANAKVTLDYANNLLIKALEFANRDKIIHDYRNIFQVQLDDYIRNKEFLPICPGLMPSNSDVWTRHKEINTITTNPELYLTVAEIRDGKSVYGSQ